MENQIEPALRSEQKALFAHYFDHFSYDEMFSPQRELRSTWATLASNVLRLGTEQLQNRQNVIDWHLTENGVTYNVYNDPNGIVRPWRMNAFPFVMQHQEWARIEKGIQQRAHLLDLILADSYGPRKLLSKGLLPPEVLFCHRAFLRPCNGLLAEGGQNLLFYAADIARGPDGQMWIVNDRTQAPSGMGYALENRLTMGRVLPELFADMHIRRLSVFYQQFKDMLRAAGPQHKENPLIVLLTPGPHNETYFEQAYLASFLEIPLVQGSDLVVRNNHLWLKSLKGLKQVDVVLRRVDEDYCDPLELFSDSHLGVAGLLGVVRKGNVAIVNPIGSGILENRGLLPFMNGIAKHYLGEDLLLPQIATWWCGQPKELDYVLKNLSQLVVKRIDRSSAKYIYIGDQLSKAEIQKLIALLKAEPQLYVGQEKVSFSTAPNFENGTVEPRNSVLRAYALAGPHAYSVMPGGLMRVAPQSGNIFVSNQQGGTSKDFWVLSPQADQNPSVPAASIQPWALISGLDELPSQTAENLFWAGRYLGRTLTLARFLRLVYQILTDSNYAARLHNQNGLNLLLQSLTHLTGAYPGFVGEGASELLLKPVDEVNALIIDPQRAGSLSFTLRMLSNACFSLRNLFSASAWRVLERMNQKWQVFLSEKKFDNREVIRALDQLITRCVALMSLVQESILPDQGLLLYSIGVDVEESALTLSKFRSLLVLQHPQQFEHEVLESLLTSLESLNIYRYTYRSYLGVENVIDLLLLDLQYPRSVAHKIDRLVRNLALMPQARHTNRLTDYQKSAFRAFSLLQLADSAELANTAPDSVLREQLDELLATLIDLVYSTANALSQNYFNHAHSQSLTHDPKNEF